MGWYGPRGACGCCGPGTPDPCACTGGFTLSLSASLLSASTTYSTRQLLITNFTDTLSSADLALIDDPPTYQPYCDSSADPPVYGTYYYDGTSMGTCTFDWEQKLNGSTIGTGSITMTPTAGTEFDAPVPYTGQLLLVNNSGLWPGSSTSNGALGIWQCGDATGSSVFMKLTWPAPGGLFPGFPAIDIISFTRGIAHNSVVPPGPP